MNPEEEPRWAFECPGCGGTWSDQQDAAGYERHYVWCPLWPNVPRSGES